MADNPGASRQTATIQRLEEPPRYRVLLHNDNKTTMDFVVWVLQQVFHKPHDEAEALMYVIHNTGIGQCGVFTVEIAETKVDQVRKLARSAGFPLRCTMEKA